MIFDRLKKVIPQVLPNLADDFQQITTESKLTDTLLLDSITILLLGIAIEEEFGIALSTEDVFSCETIGDVINVIKSKQSLSKV